MRNSRFTLIIACAIIGATALMGCGNKEENNAGGTSTAQPAGAAPNTAKVPPAMQSMAQQGIAHGQADGNAYAERMKAQAGQHK